MSEVTPVVDFSTQRSMLLLRYDFFETSDAESSIELSSLDDAYFQLTYSLKQRGSKKELTKQLTVSKDQAEEKYKEICFELTKVTNEFELLSLKRSHLLVGSDALQSLFRSTLPETIGRLVDDIFQESMKDIDKLSIPLSEITSETIQEAITALIQMKESSQRTPRAFYEVMPMKFSTSEWSDTDWESHFNLCHRLQMTLRGSELGPHSMNNTVTKFRSLQTKITQLDPQGLPFHQIRALLLSSNPESNFHVQHIFSLEKEQHESSAFACIPNKKLLFHGTKPQNIVSILYDGLQLPFQHKSVRTDAGMLGSGIYFSPSAETATKYSFASRRGTYFVFVCEVALGQTFQTREADPSLTSPPRGYQSVQGMKKSESCLSEFMDDEMVVFNPSQIKIKYLIELRHSTQSNIPLHTPNSGSMLLSLAVKETPKEKEQQKIKLAQLIEKQKSSIPSTIMTDSGFLLLDGVNIEAQITDSIAQVKVVQLFKNDSSGSFSANYSFPVPLNAYVHQFECVMNEKRLIGIVKENKEAEEEYQVAVEEGKSAALLQRDKQRDQDNVLNVLLGNISPKSVVKITVTYVYYLEMEEDKLLFRIPCNLCPPNERTGSISASSNDFKVNMEISVLMPYRILDISCRTNDILLKKTDCIATIKAVTSSLKSDFLLSFSMENPHKTRLWIEKHPTSMTYAAFLNVVPDIEKSERSSPEDEFLFLLDQSGSMEGDAFTLALNVLGWTISRLKQQRFNVIGFGSTSTWMFPSSVPIKNGTNDAFSRLTDYLTSLRPTKGSTNLQAALNAVHQIHSGSSTRKNLVLISDGRVVNNKEILQFATAFPQNMRVFSIGIGERCNRHFLQLLSKRTGGSAFFITDVHDSNNTVVINQIIQNALRPVITDIQITWENTKGTPPQAPAFIPSITNMTSQPIFGYPGFCSQVTIRGKSNGEPFEERVYTPELCFTRGSMIHILTAAELIKDFKFGVFSEDPVVSELIKAENQRSIIDLALKYNLVSDWTSFLAVEKDGSDLQDQMIDEETLFKDSLSYIDFTLSSRTQSDTENTPFFFSEVLTQKHPTVPLHLMKKEKIQEPVSAAPDKTVFLGKGPSKSAKPLLKHQPVLKPQPVSKPQPLLKKVPPIVSQRTGAGGGPSCRTRRNTELKRLQIQVPKEKKEFLGWQTDPKQRREIVSPFGTFAVPITSRIKEDPDLTYLIAGPVNSRKGLECWLNSTLFLVSSILPLRTAILNYSEKDDSLPFHFRNFLLKLTTISPSQFWFRKEVNETHHQLWKTFDRNGFSMFEPQCPIQALLFVIRCIGWKTLRDQIHVIQTDELATIQHTELTSKYLIVCSPKYETSPQLCAIPAGYQLHSFIAYESWESVCEQVHHFLTICLTSGGYWVFDDLLSLDSSNSPGYQGGFLPSYHCLFESNLRSWLEHVPVSVFSKVE